MSAVLSVACLLRRNHCLRHCWALLQSSGWQASLACNGPCHSMCNLFNGVDVTSVPSRFEFSQCLGAELLDCCVSAAVPSLTDPAGLATTILLTTLVPETTFQLSSIGHNAPHNWCVRPLLEHSLLLRFTEGCKIFLSAIMGHVVILTVAMFVNNLDQDKGYPLRWL